MNQSRRETASLFTEGQNGHRVHSDGFLDGSGVLTNAAEDVIAHIHSSHNAAVNKHQLNFGKM